MDACAAWLLFGLMMAAAMIGSARMIFCNGPLGRTWVLPTILCFAVSAYSVGQAVSRKSTPLSDYYKAEAARLEIERRSTSQDLKYFGPLYNASPEDLIPLAEFRKCVALAKLGDKLSHTYEMSELYRSPASRFEDFWVPANGELRRALELRDALTAEGLTLPEEDILFLAFQECLLRK